MVLRLKTWESRSSPGLQKSEVSSETKSSENPLFRYVISAALAFVRAAFSFVLFQRLHRSLFYGCASNSVGAAVVPSGVESCGAWPICLRVAAVGRWARVFPLRHDVRLSANCFGQRYGLLGVPFAALSMCWLWMERGNWALKRANGSLKALPCRFRRAEYSAELCAAVFQTA